MRFVVKYTREEPIKYISHLDLMRLLQRAMRRASIPVAYSRGFNPHPLMAFASALAVGVTSQGEYLDIFLEENMDPEEFHTKMNEKLPRGIRFLDVKSLDDDCPSLMSLIERAEYLLEIWDYEGNPTDIPSLVEEFLSQNEIPVIRRTKKGNRLTDIKPMIHNLRLYTYTEDSFTLKANISSGSRGNLRPDLLIKALIDYGGMDITKDVYYRIHRLDLFLNSGGEWITPVEIG